MSDITASVESESSIISGIRVSVVVEYVVHEVVGVNVWFSDMGGRDWRALHCSRHEWCGKGLGWKATYD